MSVTPMKFFGKKVTSEKGWVLDVLPFMGEACLHHNGHTRVYVSRHAERRSDIGSTMKLVRTISRPLHNPQGIQKKIDEDYLDLILEKVAFLCIKDASWNRQFRRGD